MFLTVDTLFIKAFCILEPIRCTEWITIYFIIWVLFPLFVMSTHWRCLFLYSWSSRLFLVPKILIVLGLLCFFWESLKLFFKTSDPETVKQAFALYFIESRLFYFCLCILCWAGLLKTHVLISIMNVIKGQNVLLKLISLRLISTS